MDKGMDKSVDSAILSLHSVTIKLLIFYYI